MAKKPKVPKKRIDKPQPAPVVAMPAGLLEEYAEDKWVPYPESTQPEPVAFVPKPAAREFVELRNETLDEIHSNLPILSRAQPPIPWHEQAGAYVAGLEAEASTHDGRKVFYAKDGDGVARVQAAIARLDALKSRLMLLNRSV